MWMETLQVTRAHAAQGGVTLGPEQRELGANFCDVGRTLLGHSRLLLRLKSAGSCGHRHRVNLALGNKRKIARAV